jgi:hypothetical protein
MLCCLFVRACFPLYVQVRAAFIEALKLAKSEFLYDEHGHFENARVWHRTRCNKPGTDEVAECLVIPKSDGGVILPQSVAPETHVITLKNTHEEHPARLMVRVADGPHGGTRVVDPFDVRLDSRTPRGYIIEYVYWNGQDEDYLSERDLLAATPIIQLYKENIWHMPMIFVYLPDDGKELYSFVKMMSHFEFGVSSQCAVRKKFEMQRNASQ